MSEQRAFRPGNLVIYKNKPAVIISSGEKLEIQVLQGGRVHVRPKDVIYLHSGPVRNIDTLVVPPGDPQTAWEILFTGEETYTISEIAELIYGESTPASVWAVWELVSDGIYFYGSPSRIMSRSPEEVEAKLAAREAHKAAEIARGEAIKRFLEGIYQPEDHRYLVEVEHLARGKREDSPVLRDLDWRETPEEAHRFLLQLGYWDASINPHPERLGLALDSPVLPITAILTEGRTDLTSLDAYAIDDEDNQDPDDAISLDGGKLWVHVADVASMVFPGDEIDMEARARGENLYLPEKTVHMLPVQLVDELGLGLGETSPALSFGIELDMEGNIRTVEILPSRVRVQRLSYEQAELHIDEDPFSSIRSFLQPFVDRRVKAGATMVDLPETIIRVDESGQVRIRPLLTLKSRLMVRDAMLLAGEAAALYALEHSLPVPFVLQESLIDGGTPVLSEQVEGPGINLAGAYSTLRKMKPSQVSGYPGTHAGIGVDCYSRVTSPLRRYMDLVFHQQFRSYLNGVPALEISQVLERVGESQAVIGAIRQAEWRSRRHWTLVYLLQNPDWQGEGVVVDTTGKRATVIIPELALTVQLHLPKGISLNSRILLEVKTINLPALDVFCKYLTRI